MSEIGDQEIGPTVVVIIADTGALTPSRLCQARISGDVPEAAFTFIVKKGGRAIGRPAGGVEPCSADEKDIVPSVAIIVENRDSVPGGLQDQVFACETAINVSDGQARGTGNVLEMTFKQGKAESRRYASSRPPRGSRVSSVRHPV